MLPLSTSGGSKLCHANRASCSPNNGTIGVTHDTRRDGNEKEEEEEEEEEMTNERDEEQSTDDG